jgi:4a-hydroxytetrahydrobiopterin dehydratase
MPGRNDAGRERLAKPSRGDLNQTKMLMNELATKECVPCKGGVPPLKGEELSKLHNQLDNQWQVINEHHLEKEFTFKNFREALEFTKQVGELAESQGHHPDIFLAWGKTKITICTHKIDGLTESDFVLAAKIDAM